MPAPAITTPTGCGVKRDAGDYAALAVAIRDRLDRHKVSVHPSSRVARMIRSLEVWKQVQEGATSAPGRMREIVHACQLDALQWAAITSLLDTRPQVWNAVIAKALSGHVEPEQDATHCAGRNTQFELYVASHLASTGAPVQPSEPDVVASFAGVTFGTACKRLSSLASMDRAMKNAGDQIARSGLQGWVALDASIFLVARGDFVDLDSTWGGLHTIPPLLAELVETEVRPRLALVDRRCFGVLTYAFLKTSAPPHFNGTMLGSRLLPNRRENDPSMRWIRRLSDALQSTR